MTKNRCQIDPWSPPRTLLEARSLLGALICAFLAPFGTPKGPQNRSKIDDFLDMFLDDFWEPLFEALGLHLGSQTTPKMTQKGSNVEHRKFAAIYYTLATFRGAENHNFLNLFGIIFEIPFLNPLLIDCGAFWGPSWDPRGLP